MTAITVAPMPPDEFDSVYDLDDPHAYFRGLARCEYRMPDVLSALLTELSGRPEPPATREA